MPESSKRFVAAMLLALVVGVAALNADDPPAARTVVLLLEYIGSDYHGAVQHGTIINPAEYAEMQEFSKTAADLAATLPSLDTGTKGAVTALVRLIDARADEAVVARTAAAAGRAVLRASGLSAAPDHLPSTIRGQKLFMANCAVCHGATGDGAGPAAAALNPKPANFRDVTRMKTISPFQAFNTIRLGVKGTSMPPFPQLSDDDTWALAFHVVSIHGSAVRTRATASLPLDVVAAESDEQLQRRLSAGSSHANAGERSGPFGAKATGSDSLSIAVTRLRNADKAYANGDRARALKEAINAYLEGVEPVEARLKAERPGAVSELENAMSAVRSAITQKQQPARVSAVIDAAIQQIGLAQSILSARTSPWFVFSMAAMVILREGFEAVLIIIAIIGVLRGMNANHAVRWVHAGWASALALGVAAWFMSDFVIRSSGLQRELLEAVGSALAVCILLYIGLWLHRRTEITRWRDFIEAQVEAALTQRGLWGLAAISFLAVFREAIETVLFIATLNLEDGGASSPWIFGGVAAALVGVFVLSALMLRFSARIPLRTIFTITSATMMALAVVLTGKALHAFQESGVIEVTRLPVSITSDLLGVYPTVQTLVGQAAVAAAIFATTWYLGQANTGPDALRDSSR